MSTSISATVTDPNRAIPPADRSAMSDFRSHLRLWPIAVAGLALDLWSKDVAFKTLTTDRPSILIPQVLSLRRVVNPGAMLGLGQGWGALFVGASILALLFVLYLFAHSTAKRRSLHVGLGLVLAGALGNLYDRTFHQADAIWAPPNAETFHLLRTDRAIICGKLLREEPGSWVFGAYPDGAKPHRHIAKASDRYLKSAPIVRDFIKIDIRVAGVELWRWVFNVADTLLVFGVGILMLNFWGEHRRSARLIALEADQDPLPKQDGTPGR